MVSESRSSTRLSPRLTVRLRHSRRGKLSVSWVIRSKFEGSKRGAGFGGLGALYNLSVLLRTVVSSIVLLTLTGCAKNIQTKEAVQAALTEHLSKVSGLNMSQMKMEVGSVSF